MDAVHRLAERIARHSGPFRIDPMPGGISTRRFFRVDLGTESAVAMVVPRGDAAGSLPHSARSHAPYLEVRALLEERGVRVPRLLGEDEASGVILVEDLGDETLDVAIRNRPDRREELYRRAVADLARAQAALDPLPEACSITTRAFDRELLRWELDHFREWGLEARGVRISSGRRRAIDAGFDTLVEIILSWPRSFVHRDYQSRNLMLAGDALVWLDFQDALLGPRVYDLVALLADSYQAFPADFVDARIAEFAALRGVDASEITREFHLVLVQRKLKDAGRFVFFDRTRGDPSYLRYVDPTLEMVRASLARLPELHELRGIPDLAHLPASD